MPNCPNCTRDYVNRVRRRGLVERALSLFYVYPFRCQLCSRRFLARQPGVRYKRILEDQRQYQRIPVDFPVRIIAEEKTIEGKTLELSIGGGTFESSAAFAPGNIVQLELQAADDQPAIRVEAALIRTIRSNRLGLEFLRFQPAERRRLQTFIHSLLMLNPE